MKLLFLKMEKVYWSMQVTLEINIEPSMFEYVHKILMDNKVVSIKPTKQGNSAIDSFHSYASVKWILQKLITIFFEEQWLFIQVFVE